MRTDVSSGLGVGKTLPLIAAIAVGLTGCGGAVSSSDPPGDPPALTMSGDPPDPPAALSFSNLSDPPAVTGNSNDPPGDPLSPVPEPSTAWLLLSGAGALAVFRHSLGKRRGGTSHSE